MSVLTEYVMFWKSSLSLLPQTGVGSELGFLFQEQTNRKNSS